MIIEYGVSLLRKLNEIITGH